MLSVIKSVSHKGKICVWAVALLFGLPVIAAGQEKDEGFGADSEINDIVTMPGMRSMVPSLVGLGWDNFFLNTRFGLSPDQIQRLLAIRKGFLIEERLAEQRALEAELLFYEELGRDQVSWSRIKERVAATSDRRGEVVAIHFHWLLRAINVLNHEQHQKIVAFLKSGVGPISTQQCQGISGLPAGPGLLSTRGTSVSGSCGIKNGGSGRSQGKKLMRRTYQSAESDPM